MRKANMFVFLLLLLQPPAYGSNSLQDEIGAYNNANYTKAAEIGDQLVKEQPGNEMAHYYLANALSRLDLLPEAIKQYNFCATLAKDPLIRAYAKQALSVLNNHADNDGFVNPAHFAGPQSNQAYQMNPEDVNQDVHTMQSEANQLDQNIELRRHGQLVGASYAEDTRIDEVTAGRRRGMLGGSPYYGSGGYYGGVGYGAYGANGVPYLGGAAQFNIDETRHYFGQVLPWQINRSLDKQKQALNDSANTIQQQLQGRDNGDGVKLSAQNSNLYVRNYVDTDLPAEPPVVSGLRAIAQRSQIQ